MQYYWGSERSERNYTFRYKEKARDPLGGNESQHKNLIGFRKLCQNLRDVSINTSFSLVYVIKEPTITHITR